MRHGWLLALVVMAGCVQSASVVCGDGVCPAGTTCDLVRGRCLTSEQYDACEGKGDGDVCTLQGGAGVCRGEACERPVCGDGRISGAESCDGADLGSETCASLGFASTTTGLTCNDLCRFDTSGCAGICGDGNLEAGEICDGANPAGVSCEDAGFYARSDAQPVSTALTCGGLCGWDTTPCAAYCGDGVINGPELCDGVPPIESCVDLGLDAGTSACSGICGADLASCERFGFRPRVVTSTVLNAFAATSVADQWVVGEAGYAAHSTATGWQQVATGTTIPLLVITAVSPARAWAAGYDGGQGCVVLRFDGGVWTQVPSVPDLIPVSISGGAAHVVIGTPDGVYRWDASGWSRVGALTGAVTSIASRTGDDIWAVTTTGLSHWDGGAWTQVLDGPITAVRALGVDDVYATERLTFDIPISEPAKLWHWDGLAWTARLLPESTPAQLAVAASNDVWVQAGSSAWHFDGQRWLETFVAAGGLLGIEALGAGSVVGGRADGTVLRLIGQGLRATEAVSAVPALRRTWTDGNGAGLAVGGTGRVSRMAEHAWSSIEVVSSASLTTAWGRSATDLWTADSTGVVYRFDGSSWAPVQTFAGAVGSIDGTAGGDVWVFATDRVSHYDGASWADIAVPAGLLYGGAVHGAEVWAYTSVGVYRLTGTTWTLSLPLAASEVVSLTVLGPTAVYARLTSSRSVMRFDGTSWSTFALGVTRDIVAIAGTAPDDVFVATDSEMVHFDGVDWTPVRTSVLTSRSIVGVRAFPHLVEVTSAVTATSLQTGGIVRLQPWNCRASETACADGVDDDCDGVLDALDSDCP